LLRGIEEILMKGATHNLTVRTRTDVALYVLNHKRGHLRDLENSFKVMLAVVADATVSGQQSFIIDRGEQVHTLEAAKALLAAQVAAFPPQVEEAYDDEEPFDIETESEVETEETEGLTEDAAAAAGEEVGGETDAEGHKRKRRRRRRGRPGEPREGGPARDSTDAPRLAPDQVAAAGPADGAEGEEDESEEQPGAAHADQTPDGERRPRRRGRRGGRRRRGGPEDGLVGSISDELGPPSAPEVTSAVADFDGYSAERARPEVQPEPEAQPPEPQAIADVQPVPAQPEPARASGEAETAQEAEGAAARRRSTVREKVSFLPTAQPEAPAPVVHSQPELPASAPAPTASEATTDTTTDTQPRKAGWWSRRFGNGE
jgi:ribonuclease E